MRKMQVVTVKPGARYGVRRSTYFVREGNRRRGVDAWYVVDTKTMLDVSRPILTIVDAEAIAQQLENNLQHDLWLRQVRDASLK